LVAFFWFLSSSSTIASWSSNSSTISKNSIYVSNPKFRSRISNFIFSYCPVLYVTSFVLITTYTELMLDSLHNFREIRLEVIMCLRQWRKKPRVCSDQISYWASKWWNLPILKDFSVPFVY
jgi:hypothetical protein